MKKILLAGLICVSSLFAISSDKYITLSQQEQFQDANNTIIEVFSYGCIHCYNHHKAHTLTKLAKSFPNTKFDIWQVEQMAPFGKDFIDIMAFANALDKRDNKKNTDENNLLHNVLNSYFEAVFKYRLPFSTQDSFYSIALHIFNNAGHNVSKDDIINYSTTATAQEYKQKVAQSYNVARNVGTPSFVINGKYILRMENIKSYEDMKQSIQELLQM